MSNVQISKTWLVATIEPALTSEGKPYNLVRFTNPKTGDSSTSVIVGEPKPHADCEGKGLMVWTWGSYSNDGHCTGCDISIYSPIGD